MEKYKQILDRLVMAWGVVMMAGFALEPNFRSQLADAIGFVFRPLLHAMPIHWAILVLALLTGTISTVVQKYATDTEEMAETQSKMKELQSAMKEARMNNNDKKLSELKEEQKEMMGEMFSAQKQMFKPMFYIMAITLPLFAWIYIVTASPERLAQFTTGPTPTGMLIPFIGEIDFTQQIFVVPGAIVWYILCSIPLSQLTRKLLNVRMGA